MSAPSCPTLEDFLSETSPTADASNEASETLSMANTLVEEEEEDFLKRKRRWDRVQGDMADFRKYTKGGASEGDQEDIDSRKKVMRGIVLTLVERGEGITQKEKEWLGKSLLGLHESRYWSLTYHIAGRDPIVRRRGMHKHYYCFDQASCLERHKARLLEEFGQYLQVIGTVMDTEKVKWEKPGSW